MCIRAGTAHEAGIGRRSAVRRERGSGSILKRTRRDRCCDASTFHRSRRGFSKCWTGRCVACATRATGAAGVLCIGKCECQPQTPKLPTSRLMFQRRQTSLSGLTCQLHFCTGVPTCTRSADAAMRSSPTAVWSKHRRRSTCGRSRQPHMMPPASYEANATRKSPKRWSRGQSRLGLART